MKNVSVNFRTAPEIAKLIEIETAKRGYSNKSEFLTQAVMDTLISFETVRHKDTISDFLDIAVPRLISHIKDKGVAVALVDELKALQRRYIKERLLPHMGLQKHLTDTAVLSYLEGDDIVEETGVDGFIVHSCLISIYDKLFANGVITHEEWENHTQHYSMYLEHGEGRQLLKQQE